ncbi:helix-turn-helix domain-containing protein [Caenimonas koreensis DSM 17982]|uniref:Helix-turn-helix domain-containing protein n=1 Tax=Caenimonas koreensis DSM 17982 TaxID=1121255 RepID=A0A844B2Z7_9BURK|nr:helix-turn-helix transcriptional regulator [Caenimonas koreensis]MRD45917.1 helix-turn-helix domain-containing protein [Caenimonas koreensis DSM 17982]
MATRAPKVTPIGDTDPFRPTRGRPVRIRARTMRADSHFEPHSHAWSQLAYCASGIVQVTAEREGTGSDEVTYIVPPSRAVWIAPGARHAVHVLEEAQFRTLYIDASVTPAGWSGCRVIVVSPLLRELIQALDAPLAQPASPPARGIRKDREASLTQLVLDEITHADIQALGVPRPHAQDGDKRLRALCEAVLAAPSLRATLGEWAAQVGASERTMARLFRDELAMSYQQWRQQVVLAHALPLLARGMPISHVAAASGYASDSAFTAMFKAALGTPPSSFQVKGGA